MSSILNAIESDNFEIHRIPSSLKGRLCIVMMAMNNGMHCQVITVQTLSNVHKSNFTIHNIRL